MLPLLLARTIPIPELHNGYPYHPHFARCNT
jgi:hypothetical protein